MRNKRDRQIPGRITKEEAEKLEKIARRNGFDRVEPYVRWRILDTDPPPDWRKRIRKEIG